MGPKTDRDGELPPLVFPGTTSSERARITKLVAAGRLRRVGPRLYASIPKSETAATIARSWTLVVSTLFPSGLLSHRTALTFRPTEEGEVFLTSTTNRRLVYPGLKLRFLRGPGPLPDDPKFMTMRSSSLARALLENLSTTRPSSRSKNLPITDIEARLEQILQIGGEPELNTIRDRAREIARRLGWEKERDHLDRLIGALLGTRKARGLSSDIARARALGLPYDPSCFGRLQILFSELKARPLAELAETHVGSEHSRNKAFFDAYFSNYIEGTRFEIEEAERIVFDRTVPERRARDAHDITGTFAIVSDLTEMRRTPKTYDDLYQLLVTRHRTIMAARPEIGPGQFKTERNRAGDTLFVDPAYVVGTLQRALQLYLELPAGLPRAVFMMFLVSDVHPFTDGNGRIARIMMNGELAATGSTTIIVPTVYREDYVLALRALSRRERPQPLIDALVRAQQFSALDFKSYPRVLAELQSRNWFREPNEARIVE